MSEEQLREALRALSLPVPPPMGAREALVASVARHRRRRVITFSAAAACAVVASGIAVVSGMDSSGPNTAAVKPDERPVTAAPYNAPDCSDVPQQSDTAAYAGFPLPDLSRVVSVRLCPDLDDWAGMRVVPRSNEILPPPEALVFGVDELSTRVAGLSPSDTGRCATLDFRGLGPNLVLTFGDGSRTSFHVRGCLLGQRADGTYVDLGQVREVVLQLLDKQRSQYRYARSINTPLTCRTFGETGPVRPGREYLVAAASCPHYVESGETPATPLGTAGLTRLNQAFTQARPHKNTDPSQEDSCVDTDDETAHLVARTNLGDVVTLLDSPCGWLSLDSWRPGEGWEVPATMADLS